MGQELTWIPWRYGSEAARDGKGWWVRTYSNWMPLKGGSDGVSRMQLTDPHWISDEQAGTVGYVDSITE